MGCTARLLIGMECGQGQRRRPLCGVLDHELQRKIGEIEVRCRRRRRLQDLLQDMRLSVSIAQQQPQTNSNSNNTNNNSKNDNATNNSKNDTNNNKKNDN